MIIAVDGVDSCGKTTCARLVYDYLSIDKGLRVRHVVMPGATELGQELRRIVKSEAFKPSPIVERLIFAADTMQFEAENVSFVEDGGWVVCDRFSRITDLFYGRASGLDETGISRLQDSIGEKMQADIYFVFQLPLEVALERKGVRSVTIKDRCRIEEKGKEFLFKVSDAFNSMKPHGTVPCSTLQLLVEQRCRKIICVDASRTAKEVFDEIKNHVDALLKGKS